MKPARKSQMQISSENISRYSREGGNPVTLPFVRFAAIWTKDAGFPPSRE
jgi:hypothetical protein